MIWFKHILFHLHEKGLGRAQTLMICVRIQLQVHSSKTTPFITLIKVKSSER